MKPSMGHDQDSTGDQGDELTIVAACRDVLHVVSAQERSDYEDDLAPVIEV